MEPKATYAGDKVPHPLRPEMFVRIGLEDTANINFETQSQTARLMIANACKNLKTQFQELLDAWNPPSLQPATQ
jgi:DNA-directed RNA polymerase subunit L